MVDISGLSQTPDDNGLIGGINIAEGCPAANVNNGMRWLAAAIATLKAMVPDVTTLVAKTGGVFTGNPTFSGQGGYLHNAASTAPGGTVYMLPAGSTLPTSPTDGDVVYLYGGVVS